MPIRKICFSRAEFGIRLVPGKPVFLTASTEALQTEHGHNVIGEIWRREVERRMGLAASSGGSGRPSCPGRGALSCPEARWRPCRDGGGGYHWFRIMGAGYAYRIASPDLLCRKARKREHGRLCSASVPPSRDGLIPQRLLRRRQPRLQLGGRPSLWYVWAVTADAFKAAPGSERV